MNKEDLKNKIIDIEDFFKHTSCELRKKTGLTCFHFLMLDDKNKNFITKYSTTGARIYLAKNNLCYLEKTYQKNIFYPKKIIKNYSFLSQLFSKMYWKIKFYDFLVIMPIYRDNKIICLILFTDQVADDWFDKNSHCFNLLQREISDYLGIINLYNQTLERIIREYNYSNRLTVDCVDHAIDEQTSVLMSKKVEFL